MSKELDFQTPAVQKIYAYLAVLLLGSSFALSFIIPDFLKSVSKEDHFLENLSTGLLLGTAFFGFINWKQKQANTTAIATYTILAIIGFLDEISFGQRLIGFTPPMAGDNIKLKSLNSSLILLARDSQIFNALFGLLIN